MLFSFFFFARNLDYIGFVFSQSLILVCSFLQFKFTLVLASVYTCSTTLLGSISFAFLTNQVSVWLSFSRSELLKKNFPRPKSRFIPFVFYMFARLRWFPLLVPFFFQGTRAYTSR